MPSQSPATPAISRQFVMPVVRTRGDQPTGHPAAEAIADRRPVRAGIAGGPAGVDRGASR